MREILLYTVFILLLVLLLLYTRVVEVTPVKPANGMNDCIRDNAGLYQRAGFEHYREKAVITCKQHYKIYLNR